MKKIERFKHQGFTLLELLVVMVIIGLLVGVVGPKYFGQLQKSEVKTTKAQISSFYKALDIYRLDVGKYPSESEGLEALVLAPSNVESWKGPYLEKSIPKDSWGNLFIYRNPGMQREVDVISYGADGKLGGDNSNADIFN